MIFLKEMDVPISHVRYYRVGLLYYRLFVKSIIFYHHEVDPPTVITILGRPQSSVVQEKCFIILSKDVSKSI